MPESNTSTGPAPLFAVIPLDLPRIRGLLLSRHGLSWPLPREPVERRDHATEDADLLLGKSPARDDGTQVVDHFGLFRGRMEITAGIECLFQMVEKAEHLFLRRRALRDRIECRGGQILDTRLHPF